MGAASLLSLHACACGLPTKKKLVKFQASARHTCVQCASPWRKPFTHWPLHAPACGAASELLVKNIAALAKREREHEDHTHPCRRLNDVRICNTEPGYDSAQKPS